jgi:hypothetical protein
MPIEENESDESSIDGPPGLLLYNSPPVEIDSRL